MNLLAGRILTNTGIAMAAFLAGAAVYACARAAPSLWLPESLHFHSETWRWTQWIWTRPLLASLPTFCHVLAMSLLTASVLPSRRAAVIASCSVWFGINALFEVGQHPALQSGVAATLGNWLGTGAVGTWTADYFRFGSFDAADLLAAAGGALLAFHLARPIDARRHDP
jgi:hypothetical protein